jgi:hypothetical protein
MSLEGVAQQIVEAVDEESDRWDRKRKVSDTVSRPFTFERREHRQ